MSFFQKIGLNFWLNNKQFEAIKYYLQAIENAKINKEFSNERIYSWYRNVSSIYEEVGNNINSKKYLNLSRQYGSNISEKDGNFYLNEAEYYLSIDDLHNAYQSLIQSEKFYNDYSDYNGLFNLYSMAMYLAIGNKIFTNDKARYFLDKVIELKPHLDESKNILVEINEVSVLIFEGEWLKAQEILERLEPVTGEKEDGDTYIAIKSMSSTISFQLGNYERGFEQIDACIKYLKKTHGEYNINLLKYYLQAGLMTAIYMPKISMKYLTPASKIINHYRLQNTTSGAEYQCSKGFAFANLGNYEDAYSSIEEAINIWGNEKYIDNIFYYVSALLKLARLDIYAQFQF